MRLIALQVQIELQSTIYVLYSVHIFIFYLNVLMNSPLRGISIRHSCLITSFP